MKLTLSQIKKLQNYFAKQKDVLAVYLYGSFAKEIPHKRSDIDFGILFDPPIETYHRLGGISGDLYDLLNLKTEVDVRELSLNKSSVYSRNVVKGRLIYSRDEVKRINFEVKVMQKFRDEEYLRNIRNAYMSKRLKEGTYGFGPENFK